MKKILFLFLLCFSCTIAEAQTTPPLFQGSDDVQLFRQALMELSLIHIYHHLVRPQEDSGGDSALQANGSNNPTEPLLGLYLQPRRHTGRCRGALPCQRLFAEPDDRRGSHGVEQRQRGSQQPAAQIPALGSASRYNTPVEQTNFVLPGIIF